MECSLGQQTVDAVLAWHQKCQTGSQTRVFQALTVAVHVAVFTHVFSKHVSLCSFCAHMPFP